MCCGERELCFPLLCTSISWLKKKDCDSNPFCELYTHLLQGSPLESRNIKPSHLNCRKNQIFKHINSDHSYGNTSNTDKSGNYRNSAQNLGKNSPILCHCVWATGLLQYSYTCSRGDSKTLEDLHFIIWPFLQVPQSVWKMYIVVIKQYLMNKLPIYPIPPPPPPSCVPFN